MKSLELLACALSYMEDHLQENICTEDIAEACFCSKSTIEKLFRCVNRMSVRDYLVRRRMTLAAKQLVADPQVSVLEVALQYGYSTNESFSRAFKQVWNCQPSKFRENTKCPELFPRLRMPVESGEEYMSNRRQFDISELYDLLKERSNCYFVCCDINSLIPINNISVKAGDLAILESMRRMEEIAGEDDIVFRIGGDEFVMLTNSEDICYAEQIAEKIRSFNGSPIQFEGQDIPLNLHVGVTKCEELPLRYSELFAGLHRAILESKPVRIK